MHSNYYEITLVKQELFHSKAVDISFKFDFIVYVYVLKCDNYSMM